MSEAATPFDDLGRANLRSPADRLLETTRVEYDGIKGAYGTSTTSIRWTAYGGDFQWDLPDGSGRFYVPDIAVVHPDAQTRDEERAAMALVVEVTSPASPDTVLNDRVAKPRQYAKAGIPLYLLVGQERAGWTLYALAEGWQRYQVAAGGKYGEPVPLPAPSGFEIATADWPRAE